MPKLNSGGNKMPKLCNDRGRAFVWHDKKRIYLGVYGTPQAEEKYRQFKIALLENTIFPAEDAGSSSEADKMLVSELCASFLKYHEPRLDKTDFHHFGRAIGFLVDLFGTSPVNEFTRKKLRAVRVQMINAGKLSRKHINRLCTKLIRIFLWGCEEELVNDKTAGALKLFTHLPLGAPGTFDHPERADIPLDVIQRTLPFMPPTLQAMVQIQYMLALRPSELCRMTVGSIDQSKGNGLWYYELGKAHKTARYIGDKPIPLGEPVQVLLAPYLEGKKPEEAVFSPRAAMAERNGERRANRKTKIYTSQGKWNQQRAKSSSNRIGEFYDRNSYRKAVGYAIKRVSLNSNFVYINRLWLFSFFSSTRVRRKPKLLKSVKIEGVLKICNTKVQCFAQEQK